MVKKEMYLVVLIILFALMTVSAINDNGKKTGKVNSEVYSKLNKLKNNENIRVVIKINEQKNDRKQIATINEDIKNQLKGKIKHELGNELSVVITKEDLINIEKDSGVEKIENERMLNVLLQNSTSIINSTLTNSLIYNGLNFTGKGETVCILDTGVNYSHQDLGGCYGNNNPNSGCKVIGGIDYCADNSDCLTVDGIPEDMHGHGTHVSGIVAANGTIRGIAPEAKIVMIKVCNASGSCANSDIAAGIQWCVANSSIFNISVISISLGAGSYSDYCNSDSLAPFINNASANNISVVVASGNSGSTSGISSPACVQNSTAVGSTTKTDTISSFSDRNSLVKLMAPGGDLTNAGGINSTYPGGYASLSGTSMATPHVAGAIAIINQFLKITAKTKTPKEIEAILNNTGKIINDANGLNYSRINIYNAIGELSFNNIALISPADNLITRQNRTFSCNVSSNINLTNITFYLWNSTSLINTTNISIRGVNNASNFSINFTYEDNYKWNCLAVNNLSFSKFAGNFSVIYDITPPGLNITSPINGSWMNSGKFNSTLSENGSCLYSLNYGLNNYTMNVSGLNLSAINSTLTQGTYNVSFYCNDSAGNSNSTIRTFNIDLTSPNVTLLSPDSGFSAADNVNINFIYNVSDNLNISLCSLIIDNAVSLTNSSISNLTENQSITKTISSGSHSWNINCTDIAGNIGNGSSKSLTITSTAVVVQNNGGGGGGGGGSPSGTNNILTSQQAELGVSRELAKNDKITFEITSEKHSIVVNDITENRVNTTISSKPINLILGVGQAAKLNLTSPDYYDLFVKLEGIKESKANITIRIINESIMKIIPEYKNESLNQIPINSSKPRSNYGLYYVITILVIAIILIFIKRHFVKSKMPKHLRHHHKKRNWVRYAVLHD